MDDTTSEQARRNKSEKHIQDPELLRLLYHDIFGKKKCQEVDNNSSTDDFVEFITKNPQVARAKYKFSEEGRNSSSSNSNNQNSVWSCYPLHMAVTLGASVEVIDALYRSFPEVIEEKCIFHDLIEFTPLQAACCFQRSSVEVVSFLLEKCPMAIQEKGSHQMTSLHLACFKRASVNMVRLLLDTWPESIRERERFGQLPLHMACGRGASLDVVSLLLEKWPDSIKEKNNDGETPLHLACQGGSSETVSLLLNRCPEYISEKDRFGRLPLHIACANGAPLDVISILLDRFPESIKEKTIKGKLPLHGACHSGKHEIVKTILQKNYSAVKEVDLEGRTPSDYFSNSCDAKRIVDIVYCLLWSKTDNRVAKRVMRDCIETKFWDGTKIVLDVYPATLQVMDLPVNVMPTVFSMVDHHCKLLTMWKIISDRQDLVSNI
mmetsp:Transcript_25609/g.33943  ORF Transcript_25609/g.33943 Transcript_25609/m.33943 type:complete len:435 (+) Transcript_25609:77-1381(+)